jgi:metal-dependent amidase/aminoacylase/carboxypeptidase family protein
MKRTKRTVYILPDLSKQVDDVAAKGGESPNAIVETALVEHFARESTFAAVEALTRRVGALDDQIADRLAAMGDRVTAQNATLGRMGEGINSLGKTIAEVKAMVEQASAKPDHDVGQPKANGLFGLGRRA